MPVRDVERIEESKGLLNDALSRGQELLRYDLDVRNLPHAFSGTAIAGLERIIIEAHQAGQRGRADRAARAGVQIGVALCLRELEVSDGPLKPGDFTVNTEGGVVVYEGLDSAPADTQPLSAGEPSIPPEYVDTGIGGPER